MWKTIEKDLKAIKNGEGKVVSIAKRNMGAFKDENGKLYLININCTHMGCELKWNSAEKPGTVLVMDLDILP